MRLEYRLVRRFMRGHDFYEGIRAAVIDKDRAPMWQPASLDAFTGDDLDHYFENLGEDELNLEDLGG